MPNLTLPIQSPRLVGVPGLDSPQIKAYSLAQLAAFRDGDIVTLKTTGSIVTPAPTGSMATTAGPSPNQVINLPLSSSTVTVGNVTVAGSASTGAPAQTYYVVLAYTATTNVSLPGNEFIINAAAGVLPVITVTNVGAPAAATNFAVYAGTYQGGEALQQASITTTALGSGYTFANPLTNNLGLNRAASNGTANLGLVIMDSAAIYNQGVGGSANVGGPANLLGANMPPAPLGGVDANKALIASLAGSVPVEMSLKQPYYDSLQGAAFGITLDATSGIFVADTTATQCGTISGFVGGVESDVGGYSDAYSRVRVMFTSGDVL